MFKNLVKKIKGAAKKIAPYAGVVAGMFGASPLMAAGIGALGGGLGTGNMKGAVLGGLGGYGSGAMYGGQNRLFNTGLTNKMFGIGDPGTGGFFNPMNKGVGDLLMGKTPDQLIQLRSKPIPGEMVFDQASKQMVQTAGTPSSIIGESTITGDTGLGRFKDFMTMSKNPLTGKDLAEDSMYRFLPAALGGTALAYGLGAFDEEPVPEDEIPTEYVYNAATDPLKNVNKRFQDYYQGITQVAPSSIYGYLQSIGALKEGGIPRGYSGGGSMAQKMDIPGQFLLNDPSKTPLSVLEAADGTGTFTEVTDMEERNNNVDMVMTLRKYQQGELSDDEFFEITGVRPPDMNFTDWMTIEEMQDSLTDRGIQGLERYVDTGNGEGMDKGVGAAKEVLMMGAEEAMKELGTGNSSNQLDLTKGQEQAVKDGATKVDMTDAQEKFYNSPSDEGKTFGNGEFYYDDPKLIEFIQKRADSNGTTYQEELFKFVDEVEGFYRNKKANGGVAAFNYGGQIMGPGTGREDIIPGKIVDKNTGQTSDMLVSNNEHIIPEYTLYAMGGGDTKKGHDMMDALRKQTKPMAQDMGYNFKGAEDGSVMYG